MAHTVTLLHYTSPDLRLSHEVRPVHHRGPQGACHRDELELCLIEHGVELSRVGTVEETLARDWYTVIPPGTEHSSWTGEKAVQECILHLPAERLRALAEQLGVSLGTGWPEGTDRTTPELAGAIQALKRELRRGEAALGHPLLVDSLVTQVAVLLLRRHRAGDRAAEENGPGVRLRLRRVEELMRAAPGTAFSLDELAATAGMSRYHFLRTFKKTYGLPPYTYLLRLRVDEAARLMAGTDLSLTAIAQEVGFGSSSRLTEAFKRIHGLPPSHWREQYPEGRRATIVYPP